MLVSANSPPASTPSSFDQGPQAACDRATSSGGAARPAAWQDARPWSVQTKVAILGSRKNRPSRFASGRSPTRWWGRPGPAVACRAPSPTPCRCTSSSASRPAGSPSQRPRPSPSFLPGLTEIISAWRPAVVVREFCELGSLVAARKARIPQVEVAIGLAATAADALPILAAPLAEPRCHRRSGRGPDGTPGVLVPPEGCAHGV